MILETRRDLVHKYGFDLEEMKEKKKERKDKEMEWNG